MRVPADVRAALGAAVAECTRAGADAGGTDLALYFTTAEAELSEAVERSCRELTSDGVLWLAWPKRTSGRPTEVGEASVRAIGLAAGLVDIKVCAIDATWSGLKFVRRRADRRPATGPPR